jgi:hypothetical protein
MQPATVSIASGGIIFRAFRLVGGTDAASVRPIRCLLLLLLLAWLPLAVLTALDGTLVGTAVDVPFMRDPAVQARLLVTLPLLLIGEAMVSRVAQLSLTMIRERGLVPAAELPALDARVDQMLKERDSVPVELFIIVLTVAAMWFSKDAILAERMGTHTSWMGSAETLSRAGWWYFLVSGVIVGVIGARWVWWLIIWTRFLVGFLRPRIVVSPGHPDLHGGLAFLTMVQSAFSPVLAALAATVSGRLAFEVLHDGAKLDAVKVPAIVMIVFAMLVMFVPLLLFTKRVAGLKRRALMQYDGLGQQLVGGFERKWLGTERPAEPLLGSGDPSSYTDFTAVYASLRQMRSSPLDVRRAVGGLLIVAAPFLPLLLMEFSFKEIMLRMVKLVM